MTASDHLSDGQFLHFTNHEFAPGDEVLPARHTGLESQYQGNESYRPDKVYMHTPEAQYDLGAHHFGVHAYVVEPQGGVEPDPEGQHLLQEHQPEPDSLEHERWSSWRVADRAKVVRRHASNDLFHGQGSGMSRI